MARNWIDRITNQEGLNFLLTNRIPRRASTLFMGWFSKIRFPPIKWISIGLWKLFADDLRLDEARKSKFSSLHDCFIRELKEGARTIDTDPEIITSPSDSIVGAHGKINETEVFQAKGFPYKLEELIPDRNLVEKYRNGTFVTLRLKSSFYHRFHAPCDCATSEVTYISGDTWNVNPIALKRVEKLFCKNERAVLDLNLKRPGISMALVPVAAILVASIRLRGLDETLSLKYKGPNKLPLKGQFQKGEEMGYFQHGSTILLFASEGFEILPHIRQDEVIRMGQPLLRFLHV